MSGGARVTSKRNASNLRSARDRFESSHSCSKLEQFDRPAGGIPAPGPKFGLAKIQPFPPAAQGGGRGDGYGDGAGRGQSDEYLWVGHFSLRAF